MKFFFRSFYLRSISSKQQFFPLNRIWTGYLKSLEKRPILTKALTSASLFGFGDVIAQVFIESKQQVFFFAFSFLMSQMLFDPIRTLRMTSIGFFFSGPSMHFWYKILDTKIQGHTRAALIKLVLDQTLFAPVVISGKFCPKIELNKVAFLSLNNLLMGKSFQDISHCMKTDFWPTMVANWSIWPIANFINFK